MINYGKHSILGVNVHAVDYDYAVAKIVAAAEKKQPFAVSALAVHGVMTGFMDATHLRRLNGLDLVVPDGQPVRMALGLIHHQMLADRVAGLNLTLKVAEAFAERGLKIYLYGSKQEVLDRLIPNLKQSFPNLEIAGYEPSKFRKLSDSERLEVANRIKASGADAVFLGLGCPRQEVWAYEYRDLLNMPILAIGAAFDFFAGNLSRAPKFLQDISLEWLYRLIQEPKRLWRRYLILNPIYVWNVLLQCTGLRKFTPTLPDGQESIESFG